MPTQPLFTNVSLVSRYVTDQDEAKAFYIDKLGFVEGDDVAMGDGFRWVTIHHPDHPELSVTLMLPGPPLDDGVAAAIRRALANGAMSGFGLTVEDCQKVHDTLSADGVIFVQPPSERPYGVEAVMRDSSGNWLVLVEPRLYSGEEFPHWRRGGPPCGRRCWPRAPPPWIAT